MSDQAIPVNDILGQDLTNVDTDRPVPQAGVYSATVSKIEQTPNKANTGTLLVLHYHLNAPVNGGPVLDSKGQPWKRGTPTVIERISLTPSEKYNPLERLARFRIAVTGSKAGAFGDPVQYLNRSITLKVSIDAQYGAQVQDYVLSAPGVSAAPSPAPSGVS